MKILRVDDFSQRKKQEKIHDIKKNMRDGMLSILRAMDEIDPPVALADSSNEASREYVLSRALRFTQPGDYDDSFYQHLEQLWAGRGVQDCYERSNVYQLIDCTKYFLDHIKVMKLPDYTPTDHDQFNGNGKSEQRWLCQFD